MSVDPLFAQWLQDEARWTLRESATITARWGESAIVTERVTSMAFLADAQDEADRQLAFMGGPLVEDQHILSIGAEGGWVQYIGQVITLTGADLDYDAGVEVFVLSAEDDRATGLSTVVVLRRL